MASTFFAPHLTVKNVAMAMKFYERAFGAIELRRWSNDDGSVHVAELSIDGAMFHLHEEVPRDHHLSPETLDATTSLIGIFVNDPLEVVNTAASAGGKITGQVRDYDYGYRQGVITDPFGHQWLIQKKI
jgi:PhnB protein